MKAGINYPWLHCGWDFGPPPPGYGTREGDFELIASDLQRLAASGVRIVRWFVLADGFVYGTGQAAPQRRGSVFRFSAEARLEPTFFTDFARLLRLCENTGLKLLPVLLDFHCAFPGLDRHTRDASTLWLWHRGSRKGGRKAWLNGARERAARLPEGYVKGGRRDLLLDPEARERFFDRVLTPLLEVSQQHAGAIYAWDLFNEPEWVTPSNLAERLFSRGPRVSLGTMQAFLRAGLSRIRAHGFVPTVGFARAASIHRYDRPALGLGLNQVHYYPVGRRARLREPKFPNGLPCMLGELASHPLLPQPWPDLPATQQGPRARLLLARKLGYEAALLWSYRASDRATDPSRSAVEQAVAAYVRDS